MWKVVLGIFLVLHGLIHLGYLTPAPTTDPKYPFRLNKSWLSTGLGIDTSSVRILGIGLSVITVMGFAFAGFVATGIAIPQQWGLLLTVVACVASLLLLVFFWHPWLILGLAIDVGLLIALLWLGWQPFNPPAT